MTRGQLFWTVLLVINIVAFMHTPNFSSLIGGLASGWLIVRPQGGI